MGVGSVRDRLGSSPGDCLWYAEAGHLAPFGIVHPESYQLVQDGTHRAALSGWLILGLPRLFSWNRTSGGTHISPSRMRRIRSPHTAIRIRQPKDQYISWSRMTHTRLSRQVDISGSAFGPFYVSVRLRALKHQFFISCSVVSCSASTLACGWGQLKPCSWESHAVGGSWKSSLVLRLS